MRVRVGLPDDPNRACANFPINRRAGCPQPADWPCAALPAGHTGPALQKCCVLPRADRVVRPYKGMPCRAGPMCPAAPRTPCKKPCHCEPVTDVTGVAIRTPLRRAGLAGRGKPLRLPCGAMWASRPTDILRAGAAGPMWAAAPTAFYRQTARPGPAQISPLIVGRAAPSPPIGLAPYSRQGTRALPYKENGFPRRSAPRNDRNLFVTCHCEPVGKLGAAIRTPARVDAPK